jgi:hypothetical protein
LIGVIIAHLSTQCGGTVHNCQEVEVTTSPLLNPDWAATNVADIHPHSDFMSSDRRKTADIRNSRNNWICYDFRPRRLLATQCAISSWHNR